jgi:hypothetical protein
VPLAGTSEGEVAKVLPEREVWISDSGDVPLIDPRRRLCSAIWAGDRDPAATARGDDESSVAVD